MTIPKTILNHPAVDEVETGDDAGAPEYKYWVYLKPEYHFTTGRMEGCTGGAAFNSVQEFLDSKPLKAEAIATDQNLDFWHKVKELQGWMDGGYIRFPSVYQKEQFEKWCAAVRGGESEFDWKTGQPL